MFKSETILSFPIMSSTEKGTHLDDDVDDAVRFLIARLKANTPSK